MVSYTTSTTPNPELDWKNLDVRVRRVDEARWLSSRYAPRHLRTALIALYAFNYELAKVRKVASEPTLAAIRFQWWRDALSDLKAGRVRQHDVVLALSEIIDKQQLKIEALEKLVDTHELAFESGDRRLEPESALAAIAARICVPVHGWGNEIMKIAPHWAALRRGEKVGFGPVLARAPSGIRPAVAHFRLRRIMAKKERTSPAARRMCVLLAALTGRI